MWRLPRTLHPAAWWLWALGLATAASRTTNPILLALILATVWCVVQARRGDAPWARAFRMYVVVAAFILAMRVAYRLVFGPVSAESLLGGLYDGLRLATMVICVGAANALANPKRLLKAVPAALYEVGTALVVALSVFPQLAESLVRVRQARKLRGAERGIRALRAIVIPVLEDAMARTLSLAAAMDSRGYGRVGELTHRARRTTGACMIGGLLGILIGVYGVLDGSAPAYLGAPVLAGGVLLSGAGFVAAGRRVRRSRYRPDRWQTPEVLVALCGAGVGAVLYLSTRVDPTHLYPSLYPLRFPDVTLLPMLGILLGALPAFLAPPPPARIQGMYR